MKDLGIAEQRMTPGSALREVRTRQGLKLADVSERTGIPVSSLSKIENGKSEPTMDRLLKISVSLGVNMADLFHASAVARPAGPRTRRSITRLGQAEAVESSYGTFSHHAQDLLDKRIMPIVAEIRARTLAEFGDYHRHDGEEYVYVLEGELAFYTDTYTPVHLKAGEAIYFDSNMGHAYIADGGGTCRILLICAPIDAPYVLQVSAGTRDLRRATLGKLQKDGLLEN
jgi:transcriptional regulator with XRE-family HTH domain